MGLFVDSVVPPTLQGYAFYFIALYFYFSSYLMK